MAPVNPVKISDNGIKLIEKFEGCERKIGDNLFQSYLCPAGKWTIGIGSTIVNGKSVVEHQTCSKEDAYNYLRDHLFNKVYPAIAAVKVKINQNQFDALCSLVYNIGAGAFLTSTLLKNLNLGKYKEASKQFLVWNKANGKVLEGLVKRRTAEKELFDKGV